MSENPTTPPEISSREDTPPDSLLARLRKITGLTEAELPPPPPPEKPLSSTPPVDRLIRWLREGTGVLTACLIAVAVTLAVAALWLRGHMQRSAHVARRWLRERTAQKPARAEVPAPGIEPVSFSAPADTPGEVSLPVPPARERRRSGRRAMVAGAVVLAASPAILWVPAVRYSLTSLLGWGNAAVVAGTDGWLFPRPVPSPAPPSLRNTVTALRADGATLVVISIPAKASVYPEKLEPSASGDLQRHPHITAAHKELTDAGALLLDLGPVLHALKSSDSSEGPVFRAHSSRWSPRAVEKSAAAAALFVQQQAGYAALPLRPAAVELERVTIATPVDDLAAAFPSSRWHEANAPQALHFIRLLTAEKKPITSDAAAPALLIGGDDARLYDAPVLTNAPEGVPAGESLSAGFGQYLSMYLSTPLELHAGADSLSAAKEWVAAKPEADRKAKRFILWLIADGDLLR
jgi:hypothetical protein